MLVEKGSVWPGFHCLLGSCPCVLPSAQTLQWWLRPISQLLPGASHHIQRNTMPLTKLCWKETKHLLRLLLSSGLYFPVQNVRGNEFPDSCKYRFSLGWSAGAPHGVSEEPATDISRFLLTWGACALISTWGDSHLPATHLPAALVVLAGAGNGPSLANGHTAVKLPAVKTAGLQEKYKVPFETKHARSS